mmetsp:Transcript_18708/g.37968  ORF Transcript_18708/g.37968 Transcript_18708/m.37968 type:complete len:139 (-) Transcript_18708:98-514(-)
MVGVRRLLRGRGDADELGGVIGGSDGKGGRKGIFHLGVCGAGGDDDENDDNNDDAGGKMRRVETFGIPLHGLDGRPFKMLQWPHLWRVLLDAVGGFGAGKPVLVPHFQAGRERKGGQTASSNRLERRRELKEYFCSTK